MAHQTSSSYTRPYPPEIATLSHSTDGLNIFVSVLEDDGEIRRLRTYTDEEFAGEFLGRCLDMISLYWSRCNRTDYLTSLTSHLWNVVSTYLDRDPSRG